MRPYRKKRELANWIRRRLGAPLIDVLIDSTQLDDCIDQACDYFGEHAGGIGNEESIILICPELVYFDGTGTPCQPGPTAGKWRKPGTIPPTGTPSPTGTPTPGPTGVCPPTTCPPPFDSANDDKKHTYPMFDKDGDLCPEETLPGPGWCGDGIQPPHCFTEVGAYDPDAEGPFWVEGDTTTKPIKNGYVFKSVYDIPSDVVAIHGRMEGGFSSQGNYEDYALFAPAGMLLQGGGSWGMQSSASFVDNRWGYWYGGAGGFVDIVGYQLGMQYIEMFRQMFTVKMEAQLLELEHKVRLSPAPKSRGLVALKCTRKVADEYMYEHQWVRDYALALALINVGMNASKYTGMQMPGGGAINGEMYLARGDALKQFMLDQIDNGRYAEPPDFFVG